MRCIDLESLESIGHGDDGPWHLGEDGLLRASSFGRRFGTIDEARALFDVYRAAHLATAVTPDALELVRVSRGDVQGFGVVVEYVRGMGLDAHIAFGSFSPEEAAREAGELQRRLNGARMNVGIDWKSRFLEWSRALAPYLPGGPGAKLVALVEAVECGDTLVYGDLHMGNVVVSGGALAPIDMELAGFGNPVFDLAISRSRLLVNAPRQAQRYGFDLESSGDLVDSCWRAWLRGYFGDAQEGWLDELDRRLAVLAEVENCGFEHHIADVPAEALGEHQRKRITQAVEVLPDLLSQVDRLDLEV